MGSFIYYCDFRRNFVEFLSNTLQEKEGKQKMWIEKQKKHSADDRGKKPS